MPMERREFGHHFRTDQYDPFRLGTAQEFTFPNYRLQRQLDIEKKAQLELEEAARSRVANAEPERPVEIGQAYAPADNTLMGYKQVLRENRGARQLNFFRYNFRFDDIIVRECGVDKKNKPLHPAFNRDHPYYDQFAPLRRNLAILRNYLMVTMPTKGEHGAANVAALEAMAHRLGHALAGHKEILPVRWLRSAAKLVTLQGLGKPDVSEFMEKSNVPDVGIAVMYNYLFDLKKNPSMRDVLPFAQSPEKWPLPPIEESPFSEENMILGSRSLSMRGVSLAFDTMIDGNLGGPDDLSEAERALSVEHARRILERLRITLGDKTRESDLSLFTDPKQAEARMMLQLAVAFHETLADMPDTLNDPDIRKALFALNHISFSIKNEAQIALMEEGRSQEATELAMQINATDAQFKTRPPMRELLGWFEKGLNRATHLRATTSQQRTNAKKQALAQVQQPAAPQMKPTVQQAASNVSKALTNAGVMNINLGAHPPQREHTKPHAEPALKTTPQPVTPTPKLTDPKNPKAPVLTRS